MADFSDTDSTPKPARVTKNRDVVTHPNLLKWAYEGKVWTAGLGVENSGLTRTRLGTTLRLKLRWWHQPPVKYLFYPFW